MVNNYSLINVKEIFYTLLDHFGPQHWWPGESRDEIIIGAILTQHTTWENVEKALKKLKEAHCLSLSKIAHTSHEQLATLVHATGFYNQKAQKLKRIANFFTSMSPFLLSKLSTVTLRQQLLAINGVGPETADSILLYAFDRPIFVIDTYTKRIFCRLGICSKYASYENIQCFVSRKLPAKASIFNEFHALLVCLAKKYCTSKPKCKLCPLRKKCIAKIHFSKIE